MRSWRVAFVIAATVGLLHLGARAYLRVVGWDSGSDFRCFHQAGRLVRSGLDILSRSVWPQSTLDTCDATFSYPLWTAFPFVPVSLLPEPVALLLWEIALFAALLVGVRLTWRAAAGGGASRLLTLLAIWSPDVASAVTNAQLGPVLFALLAALALALERGRERLAGLTWCALLVKPHVVAITLAWLIVDGFARRRHVFVATAVGGLGLLIAASLVVAPRWPFEFVQEIDAQGRLGNAAVPTLWGVATALHVPAGWAVAASAVAVGTIVLLLPRCPLAGARLVAVLTPVALLVTPFAWEHDQVVLLLPWGVTLAAAGRAPRRTAVALMAATAVVLGGSWLLTGLIYGAGLPRSSRVLVTLATGLLIAVALRADRSDPAGSGRLVA
jgi:hypothetical protein